MVDTSSLSALLAGYNAQNPLLQQPTAPAPMPSNPIDRLAGLFNGQTDLGAFAQRVGMGMANMGQTGGDPYLAFAQGMGGTAKFTTDQQKAAEAARQKQIDDAVAVNKATMEQSQIDQNQSQFDSRMKQDQSQFDATQGQRQTQFDQDMALRQAADKRAQMLADQQAQKTQAEIKRMAKSNGLTVNDQLQIERIAQASAENISDPDERKKATDEERDRLTKMVQSGQGLTDGPGLTAASPQPVTATDANGNKIVLQNGQWVPLQPQTPAQQ